VLADQRNATVRRDVLAARDAPAVAALVAHSPLGDDGAGWNVDEGVRANRRLSVTDPSRDSRDS
jgi:hypothetical protein